MSLPSSEEREALLSAPQETDLPQTPKQEEESQAELERATSAAAAAEEEDQTALYELLRDWARHKQELLRIETELIRRSPGVSPELQSLSPRERSALEERLERTRTAPESVVGAGGKEEERRKEGEKKGKGRQGRELQDAMT
ncbi:hypothetical protein KEM55_006774, partial [Ascosphaera atra]